MDADGRTIEVAVLRGVEVATLQVYPMGTTLVSPLLPGLQVPVDQVFGQKERMEQVFRGWAAPAWWWAASEQARVW